MCVKMNELHMTKDYSRFDMHEVNRDVVMESKQFKELLSSMESHGFISAYPLHCTKSADGKLKIKGGHHRFAAAQALNLPVRYVVTNDSASIHELEKAGPGKWKPTDYLMSYYRKGLPAYVELYEYIQRTGIGHKNAASMFFGNQAGAHNFDKSGAFSNGNFQIKDRTHPKDVEDVVLAMKEHGVSWASSNLFVCALSRTLKIPEVSKKELIKKVKQWSYLFQKQRTLNDYMQNIELVYNYKSLKKNKLNIVFLATKYAAERNVVFANRKK